MKALLHFLFFSLCLSTCLVAQDHHFQLNVGLGESSLFKTQTIAGLGGVLELEYHRPLTSKTSYFVGVGAQYTNYEDRSITLPCQFPLGLKLVSFITTESYEIHRTDLALSFGLKHQAGKLSLRGSLLPTMRLADKIDVHLIQDFNSLTRPPQEQEFSLKPGERINPDGPVEYTVDYTDKVQLQGEIGLTYAIEEQLQFGLTYRHGLTQHELQYKTVGICNTAAGCDNVDIINSRIDARTGHAYLKLSYSF